MPNLLSETRFLWTFPVRQTHLLVVAEKYIIILLFIIHQFLFMLKKKETLITVNLILLQSLLHKYYTLMKCSCAKCLFVFFFERGFHIFLLICRS